MTAKLAVGDPVVVNDPFLLRLNQMGGLVLNKGWVHEICDGYIIVEFPIGDDDPDEHSQISPYPASEVVFDSTGGQRK